MNTIAPRDTAAVPMASQAGQAAEQTGFLVVEQRAITPMGPKIVYVNDELCRLSGFERNSLIGSPLGIIYDRGDLESLNKKLPVIAARSNHCYMDRVLLRNGDSRLPCHWTIRPTTREGEPRGFFALTVTPMLRRGRHVSIPRPLPEAPPATVSRAPAPPKSSPAKAAPREASPTPAPRESSPTPKAVLAERNAAFARDYENSRIASLSLAAGGVAHDFKNALQTIKSNLEIASIELGALAGPSASRIRSPLSEAQIALEDAEMLARQMLAFTRGGTGDRRVFHLGELLGRVSRLCSAGSKIRCRLFVPEDLPCVEGDPIQIYQVLHNLVINARQAMPGGGTIDITAAHAGLPTDNPFGVAPGNYTIASVRDRGCGIAQEHLPLIFEPDFSTKVSGNGLGLASCRAIVENHAGAIRVASKVDVGTEFLVFLPSTEARPDGDRVWTDNAGQTRTATAARGAQSSSAGSGRVLVVDDEPGVSRSTSALLRHFGHEVLVAGSGEKALAIFREHLYSDEQIDAVLLDMTLPNGISGEETAAEIRRLDPEVRLVATSGNFEDGGPPPSELFAFALAKPYDMESLRETIHRAVSR